MLATGVNCRRGFTLFEMLAVLFVLAIIGAALAFPLSNSLKHANERKAIDSLVAALRQAHVLALSRGVPQSVKFNLAAHVFSVANGKRYHWPKDVQLTLTTASGLGASYLFYPDGAASGGNIVVSGHEHWRVDIVWLTSSISMMRLP